MNWVRLAGMILGLASAVADQAGAQQASTLQMADAIVSRGGAGMVPLTLSGTEPLVGMQFDLVWPAGAAGVGPALSASSTTNHRADSREIAAGLRRVVVYSPTNRVLPNSVVVDIPLDVPESGPAGGPVVRISGLCFTRADGTKVVGQTQYGPVTQWRIANFSAAQLALAEIYGDAVDPDGDGIPNLIEYALGGSPTLADASLVYSHIPPVGQGTGTVLALNYLELRSHPGVELKPHTSLDLNSWTPAAAVPTGQQTASTMEMRVVIQGAGDRLFLRLQAERK